MPLPLETDFWETGEFFFRGAQLTALKHHWRPPSPLWIFFLDNKMLSDSSVLRWLTSLTPLLLPEKRFDLHQFERPEIWQPTLRLLGSR